MLVQSYYKGYKRLQSAYCGVWYLNFTEHLSQALKHFLKCPVGEDGESIELAIETVRNAFSGF